MKNLTLLEQEALGILKQLEFGCAQFELGGGGKENGSAKGVEIPVNNIELTPLLQKPEILDAVERFLQNNGLNFSTSFDLIKRHFKFPDGTITEKTVFGIIKGENIQSIKTKIEELINTLSSERSVPIVENILTEDRLSNKIFALSENGMGYLIFCGEKIPIGETSTGKFKLVETLCDRGLGRGKTIDVVFDYIKVGKDKNKVDSGLESSFLARNIKLGLIKNQMREVNRAITEYTKQKKLKKLRSRLKIKSEINNVWIEEKVGRRG